MKSNDTPLKKGDTVQLKSGGPTMTVLQTIPAESTVKCAWYNSRSDIQYCTLPIETVCLVTITGG